MARLDAVLAMILPISARADGLLLDAKNTAAPPEIDLGKIRAPTFIASAEDDHYRTADSARMLAGGIAGAELFITPDGGKVYIDDRDISRLPMYKRARLGIGYLPQESSIFRQLTVEDNVMAILQSLKMSRGERLQRRDELLEMLGVDHIRKNRGYELSGGERRRVEIARCNSPRRPSSSRMKSPSW